MPSPLKVALLAAVVLLDAGPGCGGDAATATDAATTLDGPGNDASAAAAGECDLVKQGCPVGMSCHPVCKEGGVSLACQTDPGGPGLHGQSCTNITCAKGSRCVGRPSDGGLLQTCVRYCDTDADCPTGKACRTFLLVCPPSSRPLHDCAY